MPIKWMIKNIGINQMCSVEANNFEQACKRLGWQKKQCLLINKEYFNGKHK